MRTIIHPTNMELDAVTRRALDTQLLRDLLRFAGEIEVVTAYLHQDSEVLFHCRLAIQTRAGQQLSADAGAATAELALNQAASHANAALQREKMRLQDRHRSTGHGLR